jgi:hypothetical protein
MNLGTCEQRLGNDAAALEHFRDALAMLSPGDDRIEFAEARVAELEASVVIMEAEPQPEAPPAPAPAPVAPAAERTEPSSSKTLAWTLVGVGSAGLVTGVTTSILIGREQDLVDRHCQNKLCDETGYEAAERGETLVWVNAVAYGVGAAALGTGLVLLLSGGSGERSERAPSVRANVGLGSASIGYGGRF